MQAALAPSIWELDDVKKGVLLMLFGGVNKKLTNKSLRGEINVLLCGDPGTSKSQLLSYVHKIAPRGLYTSGKGTSAVGLTAYVYKDPETKELTLESGALVLSDRGVCCIDEFDKMSDSARSILHEAMEQQTVSVAKAGIIATLNARTSVLASANPIESRYNPKLSIVENINLSPTLLSRFDLIYLILDKPNPVTDRRLAKHLVALFYKEGTTRSAAVDPKLLADYISFARLHIQPKITDEAALALVEGYVDMRMVGNSSNHARNKKMITATPRQLEAIIRLSEAHARLHYRNQVLREDVLEATRLMNVATQKAATDPTTGTIDMDMITTGQTATGRQLIAALVQELKTMLGNAFKGKSASFIELQRAMESDTVTVNPDDLEEALRQLSDTGLVTWNESARLWRIAEVFA
jgi:DNA replication licensing factor MCM4